jgi:hypothetical protein
LSRNESGRFTDKISQQPENCENRNDPDLVQAFLKKWWVESDFKAPNLPLSLRLKDSGCHYGVVDSFHVLSKKKIAILYFYEKYIHFL